MKMNLDEVEKVIGKVGRPTIKNFLDERLIAELETLYIKGYTFAALKKWAEYRNAKMTFSTVRNLILEEAAKPEKTALRAAVESRKRRSPKKKAAES